MTFITDNLPMYMTEITIHNIALEYGINIIQVEKDDKYCEANGEHNYTNASYVAGNDIWLGMYEDNELRILSFFHEMGHLVDKTDWTIDADETTTYKAEKERMEAWL